MLGVLGLKGFVPGFSWVLIPFVPVVVHALAKVLKVPDDPAECSEANGGE